MTDHLVHPPTRATSPDTDAACAELLQSVVNVARAIFGAAASSIILHDYETDELVFAAVAGEGEQILLDSRIPVDRGIAGWVLHSGVAMVVDDLTTSTIFAGDIAESTGYVPNALMAAPLVSGEDVLGVLEVLNPAPQSRSNLSDLDLLAMFAGQAATALRLATRPPASWPDRSDQELGADLVSAFREFLRNNPR